MSKVLHQDAATRECVTVIAGLIEGLSGALLGPVQRKGFVELTVAGSSNAA